MASISAYFAGSWSSYKKREENDSFAAMMDANQAKVFAECECGSRVDLAIGFVLTHGAYLGAFSFGLSCPQCRQARFIVRVTEEQIDALIQQRGQRSIPILS